MCICVWLYLQKLECSPPTLTVESYTWILHQHRQICYGNQKMFQSVSICHLNNYYQAPSYFSLILPYFHTHLHILSFIFGILLLWKCHYMTLSKTFIQIIFRNVFASKCYLCLFNGSLAWEYHRENIISLKNTRCSQITFTQVQNFICNSSIHGSIAIKLVACWFCIRHWNHIPQKCMYRNHIHTIMYGTAYTMC